MLIIVGSLPTKSATNNAATQMVEFVKSNDLPVLWALKSSVNCTFEASRTEALRYLAMQALKLEHENISGKISARFNAARVASATTDEDWLQIFSQAVASLPQLYLVVDAEFLGSNGRDKAELAEWLTILLKLVNACTSTIVKIALLSYRRPVVKAAVRLCDGAASCSLLSLDRFTLTVNAGFGAIHASGLGKPGVSSKTTVRFARESKLVSRRAAVSTALVPVSC